MTRAIHIAVITLGIPNAFQVRFNTVAMHMRDLGEIGRQKWEASRREQRLGALRAQFHAGPPQEKFFAAAALESYSWFPSGASANRFPAPEWPKKFKRNRTYDLRSAYPLPGGGTGWVAVRFQGESFDCVSTHRRQERGPIREPLPFLIEEEADPDGWFTADGRVITDLRAAEPATEP